MTPPQTILSPGPRLPWYSSFYWRIAISFVVFVVVVLIGQSVMVSYLARSNDAFGPGNPNANAVAIARAAGLALETDGALDLDRYLRRHDTTRPIYVLMRDGRFAANSETPLNDDIRQQFQALLSGTPLIGRPERATGPVVSAPIQVRQRLEGMVILPPPMGRGLIPEAGRLLSLPGTLVLIAATAIAAIVIFAPARRRLGALEVAAERFGAGQLDARAPEDGRDEIARVAAAFNRMAVDLEARTAAVQRGDRLRRQMLADISHELRTPLTTMRGYLDTLEMADVPLDEETRRRYLDTVRGETRRLERIVMDLLDLAKYENGVAPLETQVLDLERVFAAILQRHERDAGLAGVALRTRIADNADHVTADPGRLEQVLSNLVVNALRHTPAGGTLDLEAERRGDAVQLSVVDSGEGMGAEHVPHVFERFYKVDPGRAAGAGGSGLGLPIVKAIVERHGGTIAVTSRPGRTAFALTFPDR